MSEWPNAQVDALAAAVSNMTEAEQTRDVRTALAMIKQASGALQEIAVELVTVALVDEDMSQAETARLMGLRPRDLNGARRDLRGA